MKDTTRYAAPSVSRNGTKDEPTTRNVAPLVAATLRDKQLVDLKKENEELKRQLCQSQKLEVVLGTGRDRRDNETATKLYAYGHLKHGKFHNAGGLFDVKLTAVEEEERCPIGQLSKIRLCQGGFHKTTMRNCSAALIKSKEDSATSKAVSLDTGCGWFRIVIHGWPIENWTRIGDDREVDGISLIDYILDILPRVYPAATVSFVHLSLWRYENQGAILNLPTSLLDRLQKGQEEERVEMEFSKQVYSYMRALGNKESPTKFLAQSLDVLSALERADVDATNYKKHQDTIVFMAKLHEATRRRKDSKEAFELWVDKFLQSSDAEKARNLKKANAKENRRIEEKRCEEKRDPPQPDTAGWEVVS